MLRYAITAKDGVITAVHESAEEITQNTFKGTDFSEHEVVEIPSDVGVYPNTKLGDYNDMWEYMGAVKEKPEGSVVLSPEEKAQQDISDLETMIAQTDYKIIKSYEYALMGLDTPYNISDLHQERQLIRDRINNIKDSLKRGDYK